MRGLFLNPPLMGSCGRPDILWIGEFILYFYDPLLSFLSSFLLLPLSPISPISLLPQLPPPRHQRARPPFVSLLCFWPYEYGGGSLYVGPLHYCFPLTDCFWTLGESKVRTTLLTPTFSFSYFLLLHLSFSLPISRLTPPSPNNSYNAAVNYANRNASGEISNRTLAEAYGGAVAASCSIGLGATALTNRMGSAGL